MDFTQRRKGAKDLRGNTVTNSNQITSNEGGGNGPEVSCGNSCKLTRGSSRMRKPKSKRKGIVSYGEGKAEIKIYTLHRGNGYTSFQCVWYELGRRQSKTFGAMESAKTYAHQKTVALANGIELEGPASHRDIEVLRACESRLLPLGATLASVVEEWIAARRVLPTGSLTEALAFYVERRSERTSRTVADLIPDFIRAKEAAQVSENYLCMLKGRMGQFSGRFGAMPIGTVTTPQIDDFLRSIPVGPVTLNGIRKAIVTLFSWARSQGEIPREHKTAAEWAMSFEETDSAPEIYTEEEITKLLLACHKELLPLIAVGAFTGIRVAEMQRLEWEDFLWDRGFIEIKARKAKTKARRLVPIPDNLRLWLKSYQDAKGPIAGGRRLNDQLVALCKAAGTEWKRNALRHSYASYRLAVIQDAAKVALEMGNSPAILFKHYRELVTPDQAKGWFEIVPPDGWSPKKAKRQTRRGRLAKLAASPCVDERQAA